VVFTSVYTTAKFVRKKDDKNLATIIYCTITCRVSATEYTWILIIYTVPRKYSGK